VKTKGLPAREGKAPEIITFSAEPLQALLASLAKLLPSALYAQVAGLLRTLHWLMESIEKANTTISRLRRLIFGAATEKTSILFPPATPTDPPVKKKRRKGHGRNGANKYVGARQVPVKHPSLSPGDVCPGCKNDKAKLGRRPPALIVRVMAQPIFSATLFSLQQLRCSLCGAVYTAPTPPEAGLSKYDPNVGVMLGLLRFGSGLPHYRIEKMQKDFGVPLPQSTQWELMEQTARQLEMIGQELITVAAAGELFHNDDTTMRVQSLKKEKAQSGAERTGIFTTSVISKVGTHQIALFFTGGNHAGENLDRVLKNRGFGLSMPIQMCDALSRNVSKEFAVLLSNCLPHGRRSFVDVAEDFPLECQKVLESLAEVFRNEGQAKKLNLSPQQRLDFHQEHSQPVMKTLQEWMKEQMDQKKVEPNSGLGEAIAYMIKHWEPLTLFLRHPGVPLDNNICERALKMAITHRKNSLSYKTENGARVGDLFMSLIHTCRLNGSNPFNYLSALLRHAPLAKANPGDWLPWNYSQAVAALPNG
jgi:transposase